MGAAFTVDALTCRGCGFTRRWVATPADIPIGPGVAPTRTVSESDPSHRGCAECDSAEVVASEPIDFLSVITGERVLAVREALTFRVDPKTTVPHLLALGTLVDHVCRGCGRMTTRVENIEQIDAEALAEADGPRRIDSACARCGEHDAIEAPVRDWVWSTDAVPAAIAVPRSIIRQAALEPGVGARADRRVSLCWVACAKCAECRLFVRSPELCPIGPEHGTTLLTGHSSRPVGPYR